MLSSTDLFQSKHATPVEQLARLLRAAHGDAPDMDPARVHWPSIVGAACDDWLGGILFEAVKRHHWPVPDSWQRHLQWQAIQIRRNNLRMMTTLSRLVRSLQRHDIDVIALKGAGLNLSTYDDFSLRPMSDLDLMVHPDKAVDAVKILRADGCQPSPGLVRDDFFPHFHYETELHSGDPHAVRIDLHARPFRPMRYAQTVPKDAFWTGRHRIETAVARVRVLEPEEQLIHLATHSACHGQCRLLWLYDICRLIDRNQDRLDWGRLVCTCREWHLSLPVGRTLGAVESVWKSAVPADILHGLRAQRANWRDRLCLAQAPHDAQRPLRHVAVNLLCTRGMGFRWGYLSRMLLPSRDHMAQVCKRRFRGWLAYAHVRRWMRSFMRATHILTLSRALRGRFFPIAS